MKVPHSPRRLRPARLLAALAVAAALAVPERAHALVTQWSNVQEQTDYVTIDFQINNDNPGTTYTSVTLSSVIPLFEALYAANRAYYPSVAAMTGGWEGGLPNWQVVVNSDAALVNAGWNTALNADGSLTISTIPGYEDPDTFTYGLLLACTLQVHRVLLGPGGSLGVVTNAAGAADTAITSGGCQYETTPAWVPGYATGATGLAVRAAGWRSAG